MGQRVLVIEDDRDVLQATSLLLELEGFVVHTAEDGAAGLEIALTLVPELVILDLNLPKIDGPTVLRHLRAQPDTAQLPVVVVSAALEDHLPKMDPSHFQFALRKPCDTHELVRAVRAALGE